MSVWFPSLTKVKPCRISGQVSVLIVHDVRRHHQRMVHDCSKGYQTTSNSRFTIVGIGGKLLQLLASYLSQRKQFVKVGEESSGLKEVTSGVPQGSIVGPLLFLVFINDLPNSMQNCYGFADDFKFVVKRQQELNENTATIDYWCATNGIQLNVNKCGILVLSGQMNGKLSNENIALLETQKDLGLVITKSLTWHNNCQQRTNKALKALFSLERNLSSNCSLNVKINAFTGYVMPILVKPRIEREKKFFL